MSQRAAWGDQEGSQPLRAPSSQSRGAQRSSSSFLQGLLERRAAFGGSSTEPLQPCSQGSRPQGGRSSPAPTSRPASVKQSRLQTWSGDALCTLLYTCRHGHVLLSPGDRPKPAFTSLWPFWLRPSKSHHRNGAAEGTDSPPRAMLGVLCLPGRASVPGSSTKPGVLVLQESLGGQMLQRVCGQPTKSLGAAGHPRASSPRALPSVNQGVTQTGGPGYPVPKSNPRSETDQKASFIKYQFI